MPTPNDSELADLLDYMRCCVLAHAPVNIDAWTADTLRAVYLTLPKSAVAFDDWRARINHNAAAADAPTPPAAAMPGQLTQKEIDDANSGALEALVADNPELKERLEHEAAEAAEKLAGG